MSRIQFRLILLLVVIVGSGVLSAYLLSFPFGLSNSQEHWAWFGDYLGGTLGALFGFASFIAVLASLALQSLELRNSASALQQSASELRLTRENGEAQQQTLERQRFEATFFRLLELKPVTLNSLHYDGQTSLKALATMNDLVRVSKEFGVNEKNYNHLLQEQDRLAARNPSNRELQNIQGAIRRIEGCVRKYRTLIVDFEHFPNLVATIASVIKTQAPEGTADQYFSILMNLLSSSEREFLLRYAHQSGPFPVMIDRSRLLAAQTSQFPESWISENDSQLKDLQILSKTLE